MHDLANLVRYELWRMAHMRMCWVYLVVFAVLAASSGRSWGLDGVYSGLTGATSQFVAIMLAHFFANDLATGYAKNLLVGRYSRAMYAGGVVACTLVASVAFVATGALAAEFAHNIGSGALVRPPDVEDWPGAPEPDPYVAMFGERPWAETALWLGELAFVCLVRSLPGVAVAVATGSRPIGVFAGLMCGSGVLELAVLLFFQDIGRQDIGSWLWVRDLLPSLNDDFTNGTPFVDVAPFALGMAVVAASAALVHIAMRRKDVSSHAD